MQQRILIGHILVIGLVLSLVWRLDAVPFAQAQNSPVADAGGTYSAVEGEAILFDGTGSSDADGTIVSYQWTFGDGTSGTGIRPEHTYTHAGTYTVTLTVTDNEGFTDTDTTSAYIDVAPNTPPIIDIVEADSASYSPGDVVQIRCVSHDAETSEADLVGAIWIRHEDARRDVVSEAPMTWDSTLRHYYRWTIPNNAPMGAYHVTCRITDPQGFEDTETRSSLFTVTPHRVDPTVIMEPKTQSGSTGTDLSYTIEVTNNDPSYWRTSTFRISYAIPAGWSAVLSEDRVDIDSGKTATIYVTVTSPSTAVAGDYDVTITAQNLDVPSPPYPTGSDTAVYSVEMTPPMADAGGTYSAVEGEAILFDGTGSSDADGTIVSYQWTFGDGTSGTGIRPEHTYTHAGTYTVTLTVTDNEGFTDTDTTQINVDDSEPVAAFSANPSWGEAPLKVEFADTSFSYDGIIRWSWNFGDGKQSTEADVIYTYSVPGTYSVTLTVEEADGDQDSVTYKDYISVTLGDRGQPRISVTPNPAIGYQDTAQTFQIDVKNTDAPAYEASLFELSVDSPPNWTAQFSKTELRLAPGTHDASVSLILSVPATAIAQNYTFEVTVINQDAPAYRNSVAVTISVLEGRQAPHMKIDPILQQVLNGSTVTYTITIHNIDPPTFPTTVYRLDFTLPEGWTGMISQSTVTLTANANTSVTFTMTSPGSALPGEYSFTVTTTNTIDPRYVGAVTGFYTVLQWGDVDFTPPTLLVTVTPGSPTSDYATFNLTSIDNANGSGIYELRLYCDNLLMMTWTHAGNYTYTAGPLASGTHTFYVEAMDIAGNLERNPPRDYQRFMISPTIPWHFLLLAILLAMTLAFIIYHGLLRMR